MAKMKYPTTAISDFPDHRDWIYRPSLANVEPELNPPEKLQILNQHSEGACTGFALAASINLMNERNGIDTKVSARMLYEMAKRHDEWEGEGYPGSSLRGAIHGWRHMGVCADDEWEFFVGNRGDLTLERARAARRNTLGAYYRIRPSISDYHTAINETGVIAVSAKVHAGWNNPQNGEINQSKSVSGAHAFAIIGYDKTGFWIQNSWGPGWGQEGVGHWLYTDWIENIMDGWVFRPALPTPEIFGLKPMNSLLVAAAEASEAQRSEKSPPLRDQIAGHFVHIDDGKYAQGDRYWSTQFDVKQTAEMLKTNKFYKHVLFYGHGGLNSPKASAARIAAMKEVFKANGIYPFHIMYDTGLVEELKDLISNKGQRAQERTGGAADWLDRVTENLVRRPGTLIWEEMKRDAESAFRREGAGTDTLKIFIDALRNSPVGAQKKIHLVGHSTGAVLFGHLLKAVARHTVRIHTCALMAPACTIDLFDDAYRPALTGNKSRTLGQLTIYNLRDKLEQDDEVGSNLFYRKSLLYLVSNAFERIKARPLLGMEVFSKKLQLPRTKVKIHYSNGISSSQTQSQTHGGFDNDPATLNHILSNILKTAPKRRFTDADLEY